MRRWSAAANTLDVQIYWRKKHSVFLLFSPTFGRLLTQQSCCVCRTVVDQALMELQDIFQHVTVTEIKLLIFFPPGPLSLCVLLPGFVIVQQVLISSVSVEMFSDHPKTFVLFQGFLMLQLTANLRCDYRQCDVSVKIDSVTF